MNESKAPGAPPPAPQLKSALHSKWKSRIPTDRYFRILVHGGPKVGKSRLGAGAPGPQLAVSPEDGIRCYQREGDLSISPVNEAEYLRVGLEAFAEAKQGLWKSMVFDEFTWFWQKIQDSARAKLGEGKDPTYSDWAWIKKPLFELVDNLRFPPCDVIIITQLKDLEVELEETEARPGVKKQTRIKEIRHVSKAKVEKNVPYLVDLMFEVDKEEDKEGHPTGIHTIEFIGGRVPASCPPTEIYPGKKWTFDARKPISPEDVWWQVIGWLHEYQQLSQGAFRLEGLTVDEVTLNWDAYFEQVSDQKMGKIVQLMIDARSPEEYRKVFDKSIMGLTQELTPEALEKFKILHQRKKRELGIA